MREERFGKQKKRANTVSLATVVFAQNKKPVNGISLFIIRDSSLKIKENLEL